MSFAAKSSFTDRLRRRSPEMARILAEDAESVIPDALARASRAALQSPYLSEITESVSFTLGAADADGVQVTSAAVTSANLPESIMVIDAVRHSGLANKPLMKADSLSHLRGFLLSTTVYAYYFVIDAKIYCRYPAGSLATSSNALTARMSKFLTDITSTPAWFDDLILTAAVEILGERGLPNKVPEVDTGVAASGVSS